MIARFTVCTICTIVAALVAVNAGTASVCAHRNDERNVVGGRIVQVQIDVNGDAGIESRGKKL